MGWGACSPLGGLLVSRLGLRAGFVANGVGWATGLVWTALLPVGSLSQAGAADRAERAASRRRAAAANGGGPREAAAANGGAHWNEERSVPAGAVPRAVKMARKEAGAACKAHAG